MNRLSALLAAVIASFPAAAEWPSVPVHAIRGHVEFLSDDLLEGRAAGTRGYDLAARYVAAQMQAIGLEPAGDGGGWLQSVSLLEAKRDHAAAHAGRETRRRRRRPPRAARRFHPRILFRRRRERRHRARDLPRLRHPCAGAGSRRFQGRRCPWPHRRRARRRAVRLPEQPARALFGTGQDRRTARARRRRHRDGGHAEGGSPRPLGAQEETDLEPAHAPARCRGRAGGRVPGHQGRGIGQRIRGAAALCRRPAVRGAGIRRGRSRPHRLLCAAGSDFAVAAQFAGAGAERQCHRPAARQRPFACRRVRGADRAPRSPGPRCGDRRRRDLQRRARQCRRHLDRARGRARAGGIAGAAAALGAVHRADRRRAWTAGRLPLHGVSDGAARGNRRQHQHRHAGGAVPGRRHDPARRAALDARRHGPRGARRRGAGRGAGPDAGGSLVRAQRPVPLHPRRHPGDRRAPRRAVVGPGGGREGRAAQFPAEPLSPAERFRGAPDPLALDRAERRGHRTPRARGRQRRRAGRNGCPAISSARPSAPRGARTAAERDGAWPTRIAASGPGCWRSSRS